MPAFDSTSSQSGEANNRFPLAATRSGSIACRIAAIPPRVGEPHRSSNPRQPNGPARGPRPSWIARAVTTRQSNTEIEPVKRKNAPPVNACPQLAGGASVQPRRSPLLLTTRREKTFGSGRAVPLDRNAKCRIAAYAKAWSARSRQPGQHKGPLTRASLDVLQALLWQFHNSRDGRCFPSYQTIAERAGCARSTVAEALKVLEWAGVLTWQHRIVRIRERCTDLFGSITWQWRVHRRSNSYAFCDPQRQSSYESENPSGTQNQLKIGSVHAPGRDSDSPLERALSRFGAAVAARNGIEQGLRPTSRWT
jgi:helix-turn-helix protein